jgi:hypothetical protein
VQRRFDDIVSMFSEFYVKNDSYLDDYSCMTRHVTVSKGFLMRGMDSYLFYIYATKPYGMSHDGTIRVHTKDNVAMSTAAYNYSK